MSHIFEMKATLQTDMENLEEEKRQAYEEVTNLTKRMEKLEESAALKEEEIEHLSN